MDAASGMMKVDKLDATNYFSWEEKIQLVLSLRELDAFIEQEPPAEDADDYRDWKKSEPQGEGNHRPLAVRRAPRARLRCCHGQGDVDFYPQLV